MTTTTTEAIEEYVERAAALGIDPVEARRQAQRFVGLFKSAPPPPCSPSPLSIYTADHLRAQHAAKHNGASK